jgi:hypothetical protein
MNWNRIDEKSIRGPNQVIVDTDDVMGGYYENIKFSNPFKFSILNSVAQHPDRNEMRTERDVLIVH